MMTICIVHTTIRKCALLQGEGSGKAQGSSPCNRYTVYYTNCGLYHPNKKIAELARCGVWVGEFLNH